MSPNGDACSGSSAVSGGGMLPRSAVDHRTQPQPPSSSSCDSSDSSRGSNCGSAAPIGCYRGCSPSNECTNREEKRAMAAAAAAAPTICQADSGAHEGGLSRGLSSRAAANVGGDSSRSACGAGESASVVDVVSVPLSELQGLVDRLKAAKAQMCDLKKIVDMQTSIILGLKATIRARHGRYGGAEEIGESVSTCIGYESRSSRPNPISSASAGSSSVLLPLPTLPLPAAVTPAGNVADTRRRQPHTDDLRRTIAFASNAEVFCDRRPQLSDRAQSPSRVGSASSGVDRTGAAIVVPQSRGRTDFDSPFVAPASPPRTVSAAIERNASNLTARDAGSTSRDDFAHRANLPGSFSSAVSPYMFAARLPPSASSLVSHSRLAPREEAAYHRDAAAPPREQFCEAVSTAALGAGGAVESSWSGSTARDFSPSQQQLAVGASRSAIACHRRNGDPAVTSGGQGDALQATTPDAAAGAVADAATAATAAASSVLGYRRCPFCRRSFAADIPVSDYQCHVLECDVSGEVVDATVGATGAPGLAVCTTSAAPVPPGVGCSDDDRTCPLCAAHYPAGVPRDEFEQHVLSHFQDE